MFTGTESPPAPGSPRSTKTGSNETGTLPDPTESGSARHCSTCYGAFITQNPPSETQYCKPMCEEESRQFFAFLDRAVGTKFDIRSDTLDMPEQDTQIVINLLQTALYLPRYMTSRRRIRRLVLKLSLKYDKLPASLFLKNVTCSVVESHSSGGFADIYIGEFNGLRVALKRLRVFQMIARSKREELKRAFYHESLIWKNLDHRHILPFLGIDDTIFPRSLCMVLPWMGLGNIRDTIDHMKNTLSECDLFVQILTWISDIPSGLDYLHTEEIVHGDLRGANILIDQELHVRLADFGLAVFAEGASREYGSVRGGNARWLAPELIHPELFGLMSQRPTYAGDTFAFGCVCVELCTDQTPYFGVSDNQVIARVPLGLRPSRPAFRGETPIPDSLWSVIQRCWDQSASKRPSANILVEATNQFWRPQTTQNVQNVSLLQPAVQPPLDGDPLSNEPQSPPQVPHGFSVIQNELPPTTGTLDNDGVMATDPQLHITPGTTMGAARRVQMEMGGGMMAPHMGGMNLPGITYSSSPRLDLPQNLEHLQFEPPYWSPAQLPDRHSPPHKPQSLPQFMVPASPSATRMDSPPTINAPDGDGVMTTGPQLHTVPATPVDGGGETVQNVPFLDPSSGSPSSFQNQDLAIQFLTKSLEAGPSDAQSWYLLGRAYMASQKHNKAYEAYQQAVYRDGRNPTFWCSIGVLYFQINQYRDAFDAYLRAIRINPYIPQVWFDLGSLYESCNNQISDAIDAYARASELDPTNTAISQRLQLLKNAQATGRSLPAAPGPQDVHPTTYANPMIPPPPGLTGPPLLLQSNNGRSSPGLFRGGPPPPVILDESQHVPSHTQLAPMGVNRSRLHRDASYPREGGQRGGPGHSLLLHHPTSVQQIPSEALRGPPGHPHESFPRPIKSTLASSAAGNFAFEMNKNGSVVPNSFNSQPQPDAVPNYSSPGASSKSPLAPPEMVTQGQQFGCAFEPAVLNIMDEPPQQTATEGAMNMGFSFGDQQPYRTLASNPMYMSFAEPMNTDPPSAQQSPNPNNHPSPSANLDNMNHSGLTSFENWSSPDSLDQLFGGNYMGAQSPVDFAALLTSPPGSISPISHHNSIRSNSNSSIGGSSLRLDTSPSLNSINSTSSISTSGSMTKDDMRNMIEERGHSAFIDVSVPQNAAFIRKNTQGNRPLIMCEESSFPKTLKSDKNIEVLTAWRTVTSHPQFKDVDINELCTEFTSKARCDGTKVILEPEGVHRIMEALTTERQRQQSVDRSARWSLASR